MDGATNILTIPRALSRTVARFPDHDALVAHGSTLTYADLDARSADLARRLLDAGCGKGTRIGLLFPNGIDWAVTFYAITRLGGIAVPLNTFSTARELGWVLRHADIDTLLTTATFRNHDYVSDLERCAPSLAQATETALRLVEVPYLRRVFVQGATVVPRWARVLASGDPETDVGADATLLAAVEDEVSPADLALVIYTSGSMSTPKGVVHTQGTIVRKSLQISDVLEIEPSDRFYTNMPFFWVGGLLQGVLACLHAGATLHCTAHTDPASLIATMRDEHVTRTIIFSPRLDVLRQHADFQPEDFAGVRELARASAPGALGMTETFGMHSLYPTDATPAPNGMGLATPSTERRIVDPDTGTPVDDGEPGELLVRGEVLMDGYYKRERAEVFDADGFFHTGDECTLSADGEIFWHGRLDEMIKSAGANVAPAEVEAVLLTFPEVDAAAVVGLPDPTRGTRIVAVVEADAAVAPDPAELVERLRQQLASYKVPSEVVVVGPGELPRSATGKIRKPMVRELVAAR